MTDKSKMLRSTPQANTPAVQMRTAFIDWTEI